MAKLKEISATTQWKPFIDVVKSIKEIARGIVKTDRNELYLKMKEEGFQETFVVLKNSDILPYYTWLCVDIDTLLGQIKTNEIKVKGTTIIDKENEIVVCKDMEPKFTLTKLPNIPNKTKESQAGSLYRKILEYKNIFMSPTTKWIPADDQLIQAIKNKESIQTTLKFMDPDLYVGEVEAIFSNSVFPLGSKAQSIDFCLLDVSWESSKYYIGIREDHEDFILYSVVAIMIIDDAD